MKIQIITCHDVYNYGASLSALAMQTFLRDSGHDVSLIDYKPPYLSGHYSLAKVDNPVYDRPFIRSLYLLAKLPSRLRMRSRKRAFDHFTATRLSLSKRYDSAARLKADPPEADLYIAGSDQIWNTLFQNGRDPSFYLDFVRSGYKISYAASFATDRLYASDPDVIAARLRNFDAISVRERSGLGILSSLGINDATLTCDPVFLLPAYRWESLASPVSVPGSYILLYSFDNSGLACSLCSLLGKRTGLPLVSVSPSRPPVKAIDRKSAGPLEFLSLVRNAEMVVTDSYHGVVFSLIFGKQFYHVDRRENLNIRTADLLDLLGLASRKVTDLNSLPSAGIDYGAVHPALESLISGSVGFLNETIRKSSRQP